LHQHHDDRRCRQPPLCGKALDITRRDDDIDPTRTQIRDEFRKTLVPAAPEPTFDGNVSAFEVAELSQLIEKLDPDRVGLDGIGPCRKQTDRWYTLRSGDGWYGELGNDEEECK
jgi:hypothetical protein